MASKSIPCKIDVPVSDPRHREPDRSATHGELFRTMFDQTLRVLYDDHATATEHFAAEEVVSKIMHVLKDDERHASDLLTYVAYARRRERPHCRRAVVATAALLSITDRERAFSIACHVLRWSNAAGDDDTVEYLIAHYLYPWLLRCDVDPALLERGYVSAQRRAREHAYLASLIACRTKDEAWLRSFILQEMRALERNAGPSDSYLQRLRDFVRAPLADSNDLDNRAPSEGDAGVDIDTQLDALRAKLRLSQSRATDPRAFAQEPIGAQARGLQSPRKLAS